ncbi:MAG: putative lipoprotein precursor [Deltaproteobacteria bacterium]|nr:putative lipoprotein precursor [Deltaproteobacteria bacterium]
MRAWIGIALVVASCSSAPPARSPLAQRAFYYWRTTFRLSPTEQRVLADLHIPRLYVRMFDVEWRDGAPSMIGKIAPVDGQQVPDGVEVVPVIYLRNEVFRQLGEARAVELARSTWGEVEQRAKLLGFTPHELQVDCDWTDTTQRAFFAYLKQLRAVGGPIALSATIRLHQVKYRERTGVPPVDRGMLMFYNMGKFSPDPDARAIFDAASAEPYLGRIADYPLALDVALPIWSWTVHVRDDRVEGLLQATDPDELPSIEFLSRAGPDRFVATRTAFLHGTLLREGDVLKIERMTPSDTRAAADMLSPHLAPVATPRTVSLFDLSERNLSRHGTDQLDQIFRAVR